MKDFTISAQDKRKYSIYSIITYADKKEEGFWPKAFVYCFSDAILVQKGRLNLISAYVLYGCHLSKKLHHQNFYYQLVVCVDSLNIVYLAKQENPAFGFVEYEPRFGHFITTSTVYIVCKCNIKQICIYLTMLERSEKYTASANFRVLTSKI